jgi:hypothetical protein
VDKDIAPIFHHATLKIDSLRRRKTVASICSRCKKRTHTEELRVYGMPKEQWQNGICSLSVCRVCLDTLGLWCETHHKICRAYYVSDYKQKRKNILEMRGACFECAGEVIEQVPDEEIRTLVNHTLMSLSETDPNWARRHENILALADSEGYEPQRVLLVILEFIVQSLEDEVTILDLIDSLMETEGGTA